MIGDKNTWWKSKCALCKEPPNPINDQVEPAVDYDPHTQANPLHPISPNVARAAALATVIHI